MADSLVAGWLAEIGLEGVIPTFREVSYPRSQPLEPFRNHLLLRGARLSLLGGGTGWPVPDGSAWGFGQEGIDSEALAALDDSQLKELGVKRMGDRTKVITQGCPVDVRVLPDLRERHLTRLGHL